jgi:Ser/Thr protein kinase RdoA (MazF antagonist)
MATTGAGGEASAQPRLSLAELAEIADSRFGLTGHISPLSSERDQNALIASAKQGDFVLKVANAAEGIEILSVQNAALQAVEGAPIGSLLPRLIASRAGRLIEFVQHADRRHAVRALTKLPGVPLSQAAGSRRLRESVGAAAAELDRAWSRLPASVARRFPWDMTRASDARRHLGRLAASEVRELLTAVFDEAESVTLPGLAALPAQWIHNDLNLNNLLVDADRPGLLTGIIDLGDMMRAPRVVEVGIAAAHQCVREADPLAAAAEVVDAYRKRLPLTHGELALLPRVMALRLAMAVTIQVVHAATTGDGHFDQAMHGRFLEVIGALVGHGWDAAGRRMTRLLRVE